MPSKTLPKQRRQIQQTILLPEGSEGPVPLRRNIGGPECRHFKPFLLLDAVKQNGHAPSFGAHPHRGQETVTYILEGSLHHKDSKGNDGVLKAGDLQFMCAGRGAVHDERPAVDEETGGLYGIQIWVALPAKDLGVEPGYSDLRVAEIPVVEPSPGVEVRIIAGNAFGVSAPIRTKAEVQYLDIRLEPGADVDVSIPEDFNALVHVLGGKPTVAGHESETHETVLLRREEGGVLIENVSSELAHLILLSGDPLDGQEIYRNGPFVSNTEKGARQAGIDFWDRKNGFENVDHMFT